MNGNTLRQNIDLQGATFPVVADPLWCGNAIRSVSWIKRDGVWSASNTPTDCGAWNCDTQWACWQESYAKTSSFAYIGYNMYPVWNKEWNTNQYWSMYNQFICHGKFAKGFKTPWNLEPSRPDKGYLGFVKNNCN